jgi:hypothetical protein
VRRREPEWRIQHDNSQSRLPMRRIIWDRAGNPARFVSDILRITRWQLREALHLIKRRENIGAQDRIVIYDDGTVMDAHGEDIGNIFNEDTDE